jgi:hypothetical protein
MSFVRVTHVPIDPAYADDAVSFARDVLAPAAPRVPGPQHWFTGMTSDGQVVSVGVFQTQAQADAGFTAVIPDARQQAVGAGHQQPQVLVFEVQHDFSAGYDQRIDK